MSLLLTWGRQQAPLHRPKGTGTKLPLRQLSLAGARVVILGGGREGSREGGTGWGWAGGRASPGRERGWDAAGRAPPRLRPQAMQL